MADRTSRESDTRESAQRLQQWRPGSALEAPEPPIGFKHRWIRESVMEFDDKTNCLLYTSPSPRDRTRSRMPSSA